MRHVIAGTAGHIDHGKTSLVRALTGVDTDRLAEEKRRGISIDLGFAHLDLPDNIRIALIDVPGHEKFIKNMLAGVAGIDLVLFVIAADESIKPQTREHFDICRLLRIPSGVVVLTKADLVDQEILQLVQLEVQEFVAGSFLASAPIIPVSSTSGAGLARLQTALSQAAASVQLKSADRMFRLPVDRAFTVTGFGTIVTGTLLSGTVSAEQVVQAYPSAARFRVRGVEIHGHKGGRATAGQRVALNLTGEDLKQLARGLVLAEPDRFEATQLIDCSIEVLGAASPIKNGAPVHFHSATAEIAAEVRSLDGSSALSPGAVHIARIALREPVLLFPGDRFVLRRFSPMITIAGGHVIDPHPPRGNRRAAHQRAAALEQASLPDRLRLLVAEADAGLPIAQLVARTGETEQMIRKSVPSAVRGFGDPAVWFLGKLQAEALISSVAKRLGEFHRDNPLAAGLSKEELRVSLFAGVPVSVFEALLKDAQSIVVTGELARLATHRIALRQDEEAALRQIESAFEQDGLAVPGLSDVLSRSGVDMAKARTLLQILLRSRRLVRVSEDLVYHPQALEGLRGLLRARKGQQFSVADFKRWTGVSRKYAIPLLELLDREKVTRREGEVRVVM
jgi:selenocysteine-specific elongation factor